MTSLPCIYPRTGSLPTTYDWRGPESQPKTKCLLTATALIARTNANGRGEGGTLTWPAPPFISRAAIRFLDVVAVSISLLMVGSNKKHTSAMIQESSSPDSVVYLMDMVTALPLDVWVHNGHHLRPGVCVCVCVCVCDSILQ